MPRSFPQLKPFYYLDHFEEMLSFLEKNCAALFGGKEEAFIRDFRALSIEARALVVRLANRSGRFIRISGLKYSELPDVAAVLSMLSDSGFIRYPDAGDTTGIIGVLTRPEVVALLKPLKGLSSKPKPELLQVFRQRGESARLSEGLLGEFVVQERVETLEYLLFLYFGKHRRNLQALALRDLGIVRDKGWPVILRGAFSDEGGGHPLFFLREDFRGNQRLS